MDTKLCSRCHQDQPLTKVYFHRNQSSRDGFRSICKICCNTLDRYQYHEKHSNSRTFWKPPCSAPSGRAWCTTCQQLLPQDQFHKNKSIASGLSRKCKQCRQLDCQRYAAKTRERLKKRYHSDHTYMITQRLRARLYRALTTFSATGKCKRSDEYGIDYQAIIEHLGPCPGEADQYHIDHIRPLCRFDMNDLRQIQEAFSPENHQWLQSTENLRKGSKKCIRDNS